MILNGMIVLALGLTLTAFVVFVVRTGTIWGWPAIRRTDDTVLYWIMVGGMTIIAGVCLFVGIGELTGLVAPSLN